MTLKRLSERCKTCEYKDNCNKKRMDACGVLEYEPLQQPLTESLTQPLQQEYLVKHDYRKIKVDENTAITIDIEGMKKKRIEDIYKSLNCGFLRGGV